MPARAPPWSFFIRKSGIATEVKMSILTAENLRLSFGAFDLFRNISINIADQSKIGLIGPNGVGKTSLLLILAGINEPTSGKVNLARGRRIGYLRQEAVDAFANRENSVFAEMLTVFNGLWAQAEQLHAMEAQMASGNYTEELLESYGTLLMAFEYAGGYDYELRIQKTLEGLGLGKDYWHTPLNHLSGGQKTRALLARLLLEKPDLLLLDEPTNHLDIDAVEWLEKALLEWEGAVLMVSHDRFFLDNTASTIWEMTPNGIEAYPGNYSAYLLQRQERWEYQERVFKEEKERLLKQVDFIQKNWVRASTHAQALGLLRRLSRDLAVVQNYGILALRSGKKWSEFGLSVERPLDPIEAQRQVNGLQLSSSRPPAIRPRLAAGQLGGNIVVRAEQVTVGYPGKRLFKAQDLELRRGECAALIGPNGSGKTSFLKTLLGQLEPLDGEVRLGGGLKVGYFTQAHDGLNPELSVIEELLNHKSMAQQEARNYLAQYLFRGEDVFKAVQSLSGGERARLALAILALQGANFLLLDEPTNHLDIPACEALQEVLETFSGTILLVSHDRFLLDQLATQIWELREEHLNVFRGSYREFLLHTGMQKGKADARKHLPPMPSRPLLRGDDYKTRQLQQNLERIEDRIHEQESVIQRLSGELQKASEKQHFEQANQLSWEMARAQLALDSLMNEWEQLAIA
jgi:ATP-binding cassette, subfamily F, member 3